jgi:HK97 family phage major capsid protein
MEPDEIKTLINKQGEAFEAFKATVNELKSNDAVTADKLARIEADLDRAVEAKAAIEAKFEAERKEREDLELRLSRKGADKSGAADEVKAFNLALQGTTDVRSEKDRKSVSDAEFAEYKSAFDRMLRTDVRVLSADEVKALSVGIDTDGGYLVTPDTSGRIVRRVFETSPIRQIANVVTIGTDKLEGIEDLNEAGAGWVGETQARNETSTPDVGKYSIPVFEMYAEPRATQKLLDDASVDMEAWLASKVADRLARLQNTAFVSGDGVTRPRGLTTYATQADTGSVPWGQIGHVNTGANGAFASSNPADAVFDLIGAVKDAYLGNARFLTRRAVITAMRKFKDSTGQYLWQPSLVAGTPETFAGYAITRAEDMPALATGSLSLMFGDFREAYTIVDRQGLRTLRDPYTAKPWVKFYTTARVGGGMVNFEAVKALRFSA